MSNRQSTSTARQDWSRYGSFFGFDREPYTNIFIFDLDVITMLSNRQTHEIDEEDPNSPAQRLSQKLEKMLTENGLEDSDKGYKKVNNISDVVCDGTIESSLLVAKFGILRQIYDISAEAEEKAWKVEQDDADLKSFADRWRIAQKCLEIVNKKLNKLGGKKYGNIVLTDDNLAHGALQLILSTLTTHVPFNNIYSRSRRTEEEIINIIRNRFVKSCKFAIISSKSETIEAAVKLGIVGFEINTNEQLEVLCEKLGGWMYNQQKEKKEEKPDIAQLQEEVKPVPDISETRTIVKRECPDHEPSGVPRRKKPRRIISYERNEILDRAYPIPKKGDGSFFLPPKVIRARRERIRRAQEQKELRMARNRELAKRLGRGATTRSKAHDDTDADNENQSQGVVQPSSSVESIKEGMKKVSRKRVVVKRNKKIVNVRRSRRLANIKTKNQGKVSVQSTSAEPQAESIQEEMEEEQVASDPEAQSVPESVTTQEEDLDEAQDSEQIQRMTSKQPTSQQQSEEVQHRFSINPQVRTRVIKVCVFKRNTNPDNVVPIETNAREQGEEQREEEAQAGEEVVPVRLQDQTVGSWIIDQAKQKLPDDQARGSIIRVLARPEERESQHLKLRESQKIIKSQLNVQLLRQEELELTCRQITSNRRMLAGLDRRHINELLHSRHEDEYDAYLVETGQYAKLAVFRKNRIAIEERRISTLKKRDKIRKELKALEKKRDTLMFEDRIGPSSAPPIQP